MTRLRLLPAKSDKIKRGEDEDFGRMYASVLTTDLEADLSMERGRVRIRVRFGRKLVRGKS